MFDTSYGTSGASNGYGAGHSEALTAIFEEGQGLANEAAGEAFMQQTLDGIESGKQQTMAKQISNAFKNSNLVNY